PHASHREIDDAPRQATRIHQLAGQQEERDRQQGEGVRASYHVLRHDLRIEHVHVPHQHEGAEYEGERDRHADGHGPEQGSDKDEQRHQITSAIWPSSPAKRAMSSSLTLPLRTWISLAVAIKKHPAPVNSPMPYTHASDRPVTGANMVALTSNCMTVPQKNTTEQA